MVLLRGEVGPFKNGLEYNLMQVHRAHGKNAEGQQFLKLRGPKTITGERLAWTPRFAKTDQDQSLKRDYSSAFELD